MRRLLLAVLLALLLLALGPSSAHALVRIPQRLPRQWVVDDARLLASHELSDIEKRVEAVERAHETRLVVVTLASLENEPARAFANRLEMHWRPGARWVLLLVVGGREAFIEPSDELRSVLRATPLQALALQKVAPRLAVKDRVGAVRAGIEGIEDLLRDHLKPGEPRPFSLEPPLPLPALAPAASGSRVEESRREAARATTFLIAGITLAGMAVALLVVRLRSGQTPGRS